MEKVEKPRRSTEMDATLQPGGRSGQEVFRAEGLAKGYGGRTLFAGLTLYVRYGDRLAIVGRNGAGKTTLLRILLGQELPDEGTVHRGANVVPGYLAQEHETLQFGRTVLEEVLAVGPLMQTEARTFLAGLLFPGADVFKRVGDLSEGERVRVALAKLLVSGANLLVLDEPMNHLDLASRERFEMALESYGGTILLVSHDRALLDRLGDRTLVLADGTATLYPGNYSYARQKQNGRDKEREERK
jgi:ATP-binding cassette subfamily F protein 3